MKNEENKELSIEEGDEELQLSATQSPRLMTLLVLISSIITLSILSVLVLMEMGYKESIRSRLCWAQEKWITPRREESLNGWVRITTTPCWIGPSAHE